MNRIIKLILIFIFLIKTVCPQEKENVLKNIDQTENQEATEKSKNEIIEKTKDKAEDKKGKKDIYLNFENSELSSFVEFIAELKNINLIPDDRLKGIKISLTIRDPLTVEGAWNVFLTVLEMSNYSIVKRGEVQVVIPAQQKTREPLPAYINVPNESLPDSDLTIRYVTFLENISVETIQPLLKSMLSPISVLIPYPAINGMIITDKSFNIKSAMKVIRSLDQTGLQESVVVMKLKRVNASDVKNLFDSIIKKPADMSPLARLLGRQAESSTQYFSPTTRIISEPRTNSLILLGNKKSIKKIEDFIVNHIDTELKGTESPLHIYELQNTDAEQIKEILTKVTDTTSFSAEAGKYGAVRGGVKYFKSMNYGVEKDGNRLIVSSTDKQDWKLLKKTISDLDKPQPQVAVEALVVSIDITDNKLLGGNIRNKNEGQIGKGINFQSPTLTGQAVITTGEGDSTSVTNNLLGNMLNGISGGLGSAILSFGKNNIWGAFQALKNQTNATLLSKPFFTVTNKTKAHIEVGSSIQVVSEETSADFQSKKYVTANTILDVTPQINLDGLMRLNIDIEISDFLDSLGNKSVKKLNTDVTIADGQVLVLGGFINTKVTETEKRAPILGRIPVLGWLFKNKSRNITRNYIFIFMSPTIIKPRKKPGTSIYTRMKLEKARQEVEETVLTKKTKDPIHNWFFNADKENYSHKISDFANAKYQPTTVDIKHDPYYRVYTKVEEERLIAKTDKKIDKKLEKLRKLFEVPQEVTQTKKESNKKLKNKRQPSKTKLANRLKKLRRRRQA